jgi:putative FmdB family regulatory protein
MRVVPLYEYECAKDGRFERIQKFSDPPLSKCPTCGRAVEKLLSSPAIQFKGSGWYVTDYARKGKDSSGKDAKDGKDSKDGQDASAKASEAKSDSSSQTTTSPKGAASGGSPSK